MHLFTTRQSLPWWLLIISITFNLGFGATYGVKTYGPASNTSSGSGRLGGGTMSMVYLDENLNLTAEQKIQIEQINENLLREIDSLRQEMRETQMVLSRLLGVTELDQSAVVHQLDAINLIQRHGQQLVVDHLLQEKQLLRPEQLDAFNEVIKNRVCPGYGKGRGQGMGRGQGNGQGRGRGQGSGD